MKIFETYLQDKHADQYSGLDDDMVHDYEMWLADLDSEDFIEYAEEWVKNLNTTKTEQYQCKSYYDDDRILQDCTCGKCGQNDKIKFKAFLLEGDKYIEVIFDIRDLASEQLQEGLSGTKILRFTGLQDKWDRDIFEEDIIKTENGRIWIVKFGEYIYKLGDQLATGFYLDGGNCQYPMEIHNNFGVIGNTQVKADVKEYLS